jgi:tetratricopeptide (TPR) repeat protein
MSTLFGGIMDDELLQKAIGLVQMGDKNGAIEILRELVTKDPKNENAWLWLAASFDKPENKIHCLRKVLEINPDNQKAAQALKSLTTIEPDINQITDTNAHHNSPSIGTCPYCKSNNVYQRLQTIRNRNKAISIGVSVCFIIFIILVVWAAYQIDYVNSYLYGDSWPSTIGDGVKFMIGIVIGALSGVIYYFASSKSELFYECMNCKKTW